MSTINELDIQIKSSSTEAAKAIDVLVTKLENLKQKINSNINISTPVKDLERLSNSINNISNSSVSKINSLTDSLLKLSNVKISVSLSNQIKNLANGLGILDTNSIGKIGQLVPMLNSLSNVNGKTNLGSVGNQLTKVSNGLREISLLDLKGNQSQKIKELVSGLAPLNNIQKNNLGSLINNLRKLPELFKELQKMNTSQFKSKINEITSALVPLSTQIDKVGRHFNNLPSKLNKIANSSNNVSNNFIAMGKSSGRSIINTAAIGAMFYNIGNIIGKTLSESNKYIEDLNLFTASMGKYANEAQKYAEHAGEVLGLDPAEFMRNQGIFMTLATGFGIVNEKAVIMSKNLTQLGYDISSFFNIDYKTAMLKLQSGLAGELEPLRRIGYDLSKARLEAIALSHGISKSYNDMTQAEKASLRYYAIMTQVTTVQGDMARTLQAPSNQLRILQSQFVQLSRAIGNIFIPVLNAVLPYIMMAVKGLRFLAEQIALLVGFKLPEIDYSTLKGLSGVSDQAENLTDGMKKAKKAAQEYKNTVMGFDELHILNELPKANDSSGTGAGGIGGSGGLDLPIPEYDFLEGALKNRLKDIEKKIKPFIDWLKENFDYILRIVTAIGAGILAWNLFDFFTSLTGGEGLINKIKNFFKANSLKIGLSLMISGITLSAMSGFSIGYNGFNWKDAILMAIGNALTIGGSLLAFGTGPLGWTIGIGVSILTNLISISIGRNARLKDDDFKSRFGELVLNDEQIKEWANNITLTAAVSNIELYAKSRDQLEIKYDDLVSTVDELIMLNEKVRVGVNVDFEEYKEKVNLFINKGQEYLETKHLTLSLALGNLEGTEAGTALQETLNSIFSENKIKVESLGKELQDHLNKSFSDGLFDIDEMKAASQLQQQILEVLEIQKKIDYEANLENFRLNFLATEVSSESYKKLMEETEKSLNDRIKGFEEIRIEQLKVAIMERDEVAKTKGKEVADKIYNSRVEEIEKKFKENTIEVRNQNVKFHLDTVKKGWEYEWNQINPDLKKKVTNIFDEILPNGLSESNKNDIFFMTSELSRYFNEKIDNIDMTSAAKQTLSEIVTALTPTMVDIETAANKSREMGEKIPQEMIDALSDFEVLRALSGSSRDLGITIGKTLSQDGEVARSVNKNSKDLAKYSTDSINLGFHNGLESVISSTKKVTSGVSNSITGAYQTVRKQSESLGNNVVSGIKSPLYNADFGGVAYSAFNSLRRSWNNVARDLEVNFKANIGIAKTVSTSYMTMGGNPYIRGYATGGQQQTGEIFIARESGPEMVGTIGNRSTVMNNEQIVSAVSQGVAQAVGSVMGNQNGGDVVVVLKNPNEVTGREIYRQNISKARREGVR